MADPKPHLSASQLSMFQRCGEQYRRRYIEGDIVPPGAAALVGRATDSGVTADLSHKIETGRLLEAEAVEQAARDALERAWSGGVHLPEAKNAQDYQREKGIAADRSVRLASLHHGSLAPDLRPAEVQKSWRLLLEGYPYDLIGYIDIVEETAEVRDTKTKAKSPSKTEADDSDQLTMYAMAMEALGRPAPRQHLDYLVDLKTPKAFTLSTSRGNADFQALLARLETMMAALEKGVFVPANPDDWVCSQKWCGYWPTCPYARRPTLIALEGGKSDSRPADLAGALKESLKQGSNA